MEDQGFDRITIEHMGLGFGNTSTLSGRDWVVFRRDGLEALRALVNKTEADLEQSKARHRRATKHIADLTTVNETLMGTIDGLNWVKKNRDTLSINLSEAHEALRKAGEENERVESLYGSALESIRKLDSEKWFLQQDLDSARREVEKLMGKLTREKSRNLIDPHAAAEERKAAYNADREARIAYLEAELKELRAAVVGLEGTEGFDYVATATAQRNMITTLNNVIEDQNQTIEDLVEKESRMAFSMHDAHDGWDITLEELGVCKEEARLLSDVAEDNYSALVEADEEIYFLKKQNERLHSQSQETINRLYDLYTGLPYDAKFINGITILEWFRDWVKALTESGKLHDGYGYINRNNTRTFEMSEDMDFADWKKRSE